MIYNFYTEFANTEEFTKTNRSAEWKTSPRKRRGFRLVY